MKKKLIINERGKKIIFKKRILRTPVHLIVTESEFQLLEVQLRLQGIADYVLFDYIEEAEPKIEDIKLEVQEKLKPIKASREPNTILERLASDK